MKELVIEELSLRLDVVEVSQIEKILSDKEYLNRVNMNRPEIIEKIKQTLEKMKNDYAMASFRYMKLDYEAYTKNRKLKEIALSYIKYINNNIQTNRKR